MHGFQDKILLVDLAAGSSRAESPSEETYKRVLGGCGLAVHYLLDLVKPGSDPLGPGNVLGFIPGLFTGSPAPLSGRMMVCAKSPLTGGWGESNIGGHVGAAIKRAGVDGIFLSGTSPRPVYVLVDNHDATVHDATGAWELDCAAAEAFFKEKHGKAVKVLGIGPAGEAMSLAAGIRSGHRMAARSGLGAVMGSKKVKAVVVEGSGSVSLADKQAAQAMLQQYSARVKGKSESLVARMATKAAPVFGSLVAKLNMDLSNAQPIAARVFSKWGTAFATGLQVLMADSPIKNFKGTPDDFPGTVAQAFNCQSFEHLIVKHQGCFACPVQCGHIMRVPEMGDNEIQRPEYETLAAFGPLLLNGDVTTVFKANEYCNKAGLDTISAGVVLAFAIECCEQGALTAADFKCEAHPGGFLPSWNDPSCILPLLELVVRREGIGDTLALGVEKAAKIIGKGSEYYAMAANGQEIPMHDPRRTRGLAITYLSDPTPGRHTASCLDFSSMGELNKLIPDHPTLFKLGRKARVTGVQHAKFAKFRNAWNALGLCEFALAFEEYPLFALFEAITGWKMDMDAFLNAGWRIQAMRQVFNAREGAIRHDIPRRALGRPPVEKGPIGGVDIWEATWEGIRQYYASIGFSENGVPLASTLELLGLEKWKEAIASSRGCALP